MFLINAIYFKGTWVYEFDKGRTKDEPFMLRGGAQRAVAMMHHQGGAHVGYYAGPGFRVVDLPYGASAYSMTIVLPNPGHDVDSVIAGLSTDAWAAIAD